MIQTTTAPEAAIKAAEREMLKYDWLKNHVTMTMAKTMVYGDEEMSAKHNIITKRLGNALSFVVESKNRIIENG